MPSRPRSIRTTLICLALVSAVTGLTGAPGSAQASLVGVWQGPEDDGTGGTITVAVDEDGEGRLAFFARDSRVIGCGGEAGVAAGRGERIDRTTTELHLYFDVIVCADGTRVRTPGGRMVLLHEGDRLRLDPDSGTEWVGTRVCDPDDPAPGTIMGTDGDDVLNGTRNADIIDGGDGHDRIWGRGGDDIVCGGAGDDEVYGNFGLDVVWGDAGDDVLYGGFNADGVFGNSGSDEVRPQAGDDFGSGGAGDDILDGFYGHDVLDGGDDDDDAWGRMGRDLLLGGSGDDFLSGGRGPDEANGEQGTDTCRAETCTACEGDAPEPPGACTPSPAPRVGDLDARVTPYLPETEPRGVYQDPVFGTCVTRVTDRASDPAPGDPSPGLTNEYSRVQAWNWDGSRFVVRGTEGTWYVYDADSHLPTGELPITEEPRWDGDDPDLLYYADGTELRAYDVAAGTDQLVHDFGDVLPGADIVSVRTRWEGSPSRDTATWGLMAQDDEWLAAAFLVYDLDADTVVAVRDLRGLDDWRRDVDSVTMTPSGTSFLGYFPDCPEGTMGTDSSPCGLMVYDRDLTGGRGLVRAIGHSDAAYAADGGEVVVYQDVDTDHIAVVDLDTGNVSQLWQIDYSYSPIGLHFSGRAFDRPGWALVSTYEGADATWMDDSVFAVELRPNGRVIRLAHTHSVVDPESGHGYWAEPRATVNRDFTKVLFATNWGRSDTDEIDTYEIEIPDAWFEG